MYLEQTPPAAQGSHGTPAAAKRRLNMSPGAAAKRPRADGDAADMLQLKAKNDVSSVSHSSPPMASDWTRSLLLQRCPAAPAGPLQYMMLVVYIGLIHS